MSNRYTDRPPAGGKSRKGTYYSILFPTMPTLDRKPMQVTLVQKQGHHDILTLTFKKTSEYWFTEIPTGLPIQFDWSQLGVTTTWVGYVSYVSKVVTALGDKTMEVVCVGASFPLKDQTTKVFSQSTVPDAVAQIASDMGLKFIGDPHPRKFPQLVIAGQSYWSWIQSQAEKIGYVSYVDGVTLYFRKLDKLLAQNSTSIPVLSIEDKTTFPGQLLYDRTLEYFKVLRGDYLETEKPLRTTKHVAGVNPVTGAAHSASASPADPKSPTRETVSSVLFNEYRTDKVSITEKSGDISAEDAAQTSRFTIPAKARGLGDYRIRPYATVEVLGTGSSTDGLWLVQEVTHTFGKFGIYEVDMVLLSEGTGQALYQSLDAAKSARKDTVNIMEKLSEQSNTIGGNSQGKIMLKTPLNPVQSSQLGFSDSLARWVAR